MVGIDRGGLTVVEQSSSFYIPGGKMAFRLLGLFLVCSAQVLWADTQVTGYVNGSSVSMHVSETGSITRIDGYVNGHSYNVSIDKTNPQRVQVSGYANGSSISVSTEKLQDRTHVTGYLNGSSVSMEVTGNQEVNTIISSLLQIPVSF